MNNDDADPGRDRSDSDELFPIVSSVYASIDQPERLREALQALNSLLRGSSTQLLLVATDAGKVAELELSGGADGNLITQEEWMRRWDCVELPLSLLRTHRAGRVFRSHCDGESGFLANTRFVDNFLTATGFASAIAGIIACDASTAIMVVQLSKTATPYGEAAAEALARVLPHFARSCQLRGKLGAFARGASPSRLLRLLPLPCMLTDEAGRCIERNDALEEIMGTLGMKVISGRTRFADSYLQDSWQAALAEVKLTALPCALLASAEEGRHWKVHISPIDVLTDAGTMAEKPLMLVVMEERSATMGSAANGLMAASTRNLTPAENEVLSGLLRGHTAKLIARARGASVNTVRSQIMTILEKTGHHTQKELIASFGASSFGASSFGTSTFGASAFGSDGFPASNPASRR